MPISDLIDPSRFGLPSRTVLVDNGGGSITLVKMRKSRIIMKDGEKILAMRDKVFHAGGCTSFTLKTNAPICSKTRKFLEESGIRIEQVNDT